MANRSARKPATGKKEVKQVDDEEVAIVSSENKSRFTGENIDAAKKAEIIKELGSGLGLVATAKKLGVSHHTVVAIRDDALEESPRFAEAYYKARMPAKLLNIAAQGMDAIERKMDQIPAGMLGVTVGIAIDKYLAISGQATSVVEHRHIANSSALGDSIAGAIDIEATVMPA